MFERQINRELRIWAKSKYRKPLVLRGARQVGKTTVVKEFSKEFENYIYLNLEKEEHKAYFQKYSEVTNLYSALLFDRDLPQSRNTLLFIDEIQAFPEAVAKLRYFYEDLPEVYVISAGSMLESLFNTHFSFPVGRVEYMFLRPVSFREFLNANGETNRLEIFDTVPLPEFASDFFFSKFHEYSIVGGMPEIVNQYISDTDLVRLKPLYNALVTGYKDDVEKYAKDKTTANLYRTIIEAAFYEGGTRITFENFANTKRSYKDISEALRALEKALLLNLIYPVTSAELPMQPNIRRAPRLQILDSGLMANQIGLQSEMFGVKDLNNIYRGIFIEHLVGQELAAFQFHEFNPLNFWVREKKTSGAEVDFVVNYKGKVIPIEVKSGAVGKLRSLHQFMLEAPHKIAVRLYAGEIRVDEITAPEGNTYQLLSLPYFLASKIEEYLDWMIANYS